MAEVRLSGFVTSPVRTRPALASLFDFLEGFVETAAAPGKIEASDRCSSFRKAHRDALTDAAARPGDERDFSFETE